ncbi:hypothetical protein [Streptomyces antibioticus]|uniref:hypothetical protein n=1 Tax=Streptomyces antibioticus TaxID=1890 RepID=UPI0033E5AD5E
MKVVSAFANGFLLPSLVASTGVGLCMVANTSLATSGAAVEDAGLLSGLVNAGRQIGGSLGLAVLSTVASTVAATRGTPTSAAERLMNWSPVTTGPSSSPQGSAPWPP